VIKKAFSYFYRSVVVSKLLMVSSFVPMSPINPDEAAFAIATALVKRQKLLSLPKTSTIRAGEQPLTQ
jgi:hypothetical protein